MKQVTTKYSGNPVIQTVANDTDDYSTPEQVLNSWVNNFSLKAENSNDLGLRNPQVGAFHAIVAHWTCSSEICTVVLPTGTGKTETMISVFVSERLGKLLVIVPTDPLRTQISKKFIELGLLKALGLIHNAYLHPVVGIIKKGFSSAQTLDEFVGKCNVVVTTADMACNLTLLYPGLFEKAFTHVFIDEAHHSEAKSWKKVRESFSDADVVQFTATPFRNDNKKIDGKIIYNYPLKKAQLEGYFKAIKFKKIYEYNSAKKDSALAEEGVQQLRVDKQKHKHILLARVGTRSRADEVYEIYNQYSSEFRVVKIHSGLKSKEKLEAHNRIIGLDVDIIICVDMLGEGFDLPNLKIAVFHDIRQSLPITLQFVGRFTRTSRDAELGDATIVANLADLDVANELEVLYAKNPDWNTILPMLSESRTQKELDLYNFIQGFQDQENFPISVQSITPALSSVVFRNKTDTWFPKNYQKGLPHLNNYEVIRDTYNSEEKILIIVTAKRLMTEWIDNENITDLIWHYYIIYWDYVNNLLFINSSDNSSLHIDLAKSIIGEDAELITGNNGGKIFRVLSGINRFKLQNVALSEIIGKFIRFVMRVGSDIEPALTQAQLNKAKKTLIFGAGYENGDDISIGCSYKGRIWSRRRNDIPTLIKWFHAIGRKILDDNINGDDILKGALVARSLSSRPNEVAYLVDWNEEVYKHSEIRYAFNIEGRKYEIYTVDLTIEDRSPTDDIRIAIVHNGIKLIELDLVFYQDRSGNPTFQFKKTDPNKFAVAIVGTKQIDLEEYFYYETPSIWFSNGDYLEGNSYFELKSIIQPFDKNKIEVIDWTGVNLRVESQGCTPKKIDSIQYRMIEILSKKNYDIIFDDDDSGEIADIVTLKAENDEICIELYHLKYAKGGVPSGQIGNLYEVCGQAQKSVNWKFKKGKEILEHFLRRESLRKQNQLDSRFQNGDEQKLIELLDLVHNRVPFNFHIYIVQPGISKANLSTSQLSLLAVTETYLMERAALQLNVIGSD